MTKVSAGASSNVLQVVRMCSHVRTILVGIVRGTAQLQKLCYGVPARWDVQLQAPTARRGCRF